MRLVSLNFSSLILLFAMVGCASTDIVEMSDSTVQHKLQDADADGVIDARDQCQETLDGAGISNHGCGDMSQIEINIALYLQFEHDSAKLTDADIKKIGTHAGFLKRHPAKKIQIAGHTSKVGSASYNQRLGQARAESVKAALVEVYGLKAERFEPVSYGFSRPVQEGETPEAHALNRRVEIQSIGFANKQHNMKWSIYK